MIREHCFGKEPSKRKAKASVGSVGIGSGKVRILSISLIGDSSLYLQSIISKNVLTYTGTNEDFRSSHTGDADKETLPLPCHVLIDKRASTEEVFAI